MSPSQPTCPLLLPPTLPPTQLFVSENGVEGEVLRVPTFHNPTSAATAIATHALLIPGNPGLIDYYLPFLQNLWHRLQQSHHPHLYLHGLGLPGHDLRHRNGNTVFRVLDHKKYVLSYLRSAIMSKSSAPCNIVLMGHSYGSFLALQLADELRQNEYNNISFVMLMPCIWEMGKCAGLFARLVLLDYLKLSSWAIAIATGLLPPLVRDLLISAAGHASDVAHVTRAFVDGSQQRHLYSNMLTLGRDETVQIRHPAKSPGVNKASSSLAVYVENDKWCPGAAQDVIGEMFGEGLDVCHLGDQVSHAFVLSKHQTEHVAQVVADWLSAHIAPAEQASVTVSQRLGL